MIKCAALVCIKAPLFKCWHAICSTVFLFHTIHDLYQCASEQNQAYVIPQYPTYIWLCWLVLPLEAFLLLSLLAYLWELPFIVLPGSALLGFASGVVLHSLYLLLPRLHQLVIALADLLLLWTHQITIAWVKAIEVKNSFILWGC